MARPYGFWQMLHDMVFNGNRVSPEFRDDERKDEGHEPCGGSGRDSGSSHRVIVREFGPSESAGKAFRSVFGDDN
jgi:hypothetical protein